ncbi:type I-E CRISPR-associated protein Cas6/Cse3/CasE [Methylobacterium currus]|uniref:Type I-E CRISPR-associated protein Cas6/Cse3/CasE n=1 Tax=Methylobacterium currus TaxID=2051553 RepID=A0A2R4WH51_9HYPH|nr:type I-E CRISPR-associated protein Cas6/Cse3/CasE [Methylobacterium currus]AWB20870.1 type I-E CRISPR-associated protein Cas6/Cse3/CasE [Methylobacterium currus]UHC14295.1 type I-E CRISPR-associated protein Cas6/Cse3/CasE [Methylobacterium currus]
MTLTLIQMRPALGPLLRWAHRRHVVAAQGPDDLGYALHAILAAAFGAQAPKPFVLLDPPRRHARPGADPAPQLLGYTTGDVAGLRDHAAAFADPEVAEALDLDGLAAKAMPARFSAGTRLGFRTRIRPTVRRDRDGDRARTREQDAYLAALDPYEGQPAPFSRGEVYRDWLARHLAAGGAELEMASLDAFRLGRGLRRGRDRELRQIPSSSPTMKGAAGHPDATVTGVLAVRDPEAFAALLARGVGRHRAFGFGMLLLRPPG